MSRGTSPKLSLRATDHQQPIGKSESRVQCGCPLHLSKPHSVQAGGSCDVQERANYVNDKPTIHPPNMVGEFSKAKERGFTVKQMLEKNRFVYNVRPPREEVVKELMKDAGSCSNVNASVRLKNMTTPAIRRQLRKKLAESLAGNRRERAFAKATMYDNRPRADELERLVAEYPALSQVDWDAEPVKSDINCELWLAYHARHCSLCSPTKVHQDCYFKLIYHFLRTGFEPPEAPDVEQVKKAPHRAYVKQWKKEKKRCGIAFKKWIRESESLMSERTNIMPSFYSPLLPVVREKDKWRFECTGAEYKVRLCLDLKCSGYNERLYDWPFRYRGLEAIAESVQENDWLAALDISRFYLRLPAGKKLREAQWFQDPSSYAGSTADNDKRANHRLKFRQLLAVAFGLKSAPAWASLVSGELCRIFESFGIHVAGVYIDDILLRARSKERLQEDMQLAERIATALGLPFNDKTVGPAQKLIYLGVEIDTTCCALRLTQEHRKYAMSRVAEALKKSKISRATLDSLCGILTWVSFVFDSGKPRRNRLYSALAQAIARGKDVELRGELRAQLHWWYQALRKRTCMAAKFWTSQPDTPLVCSDASGEDGWGACAFGLHIVGAWPANWRQSTGEDDPHMLYKELVPPVVTTLLLAPMLKQQVLCCALDNAGVAFTINKLSCGCERSLELLRPFADSLARGRFAVIAGHAHRVHNSHTDKLSHSLSCDMWSQVADDAPIKKKHRAELHFAVLDVKTAECFVATISFADPVLKRCIKRGAVDAGCGSRQAPKSRETSA